ncbi:hypothetical protein CDCA_CDCA14G3926 [Cyanidium caldarium]|uniref:Uncharacterized protein n=1 Tax=Cyanidium caldarium TaxID=2771 RepID=A0AAV9J0H7_CYACA|nr:hypothetical protein CDCA_CDCA14G3926 [Cyanidium caldarium]
MLASSDMFTRRLFLVVLGVALASLLALPAAALPAVRVESSSGGSHGNSSGGTIDVFYPPPSPALSPPPTYDLNRTATVVIAGADAISDFPPAFNFFGHGAAITFSGGAQYAAVYPNDDAGTYRLLNATELLQDLKFRYFVYYGHPLAWYAAGNLPGNRSTVSQEYVPSGNSTRFIAGTFAITQVNTIISGTPGVVNVAFNAYDPHNVSAAPHLPNALNDYGVVTFTKVPCTEAGITC